MLELYLIRHGRSIWNGTGRIQGGRVGSEGDVPLHDEGVRQAEALAKRLETFSFDAVYASDLQRARQTAEIALPDSSPIFDARLREVDVGVFEGRLWDELAHEEQNQFAVWFAGPYHEKIPGGESSDDLQTRSLEWLAALPKEGHVAAFTHGGIIESLLYAITGRPQATATSWREQGGWGFAIKNTSITKLNITHDFRTIERVSDAAHLEGHL